MPPLSVPPEFHSGLATLQRLKVEQIDDLVGAVRGAPIKFYASHLADEVANRAKSIPREDVAEVVQMVTSLEFVRATAEVSISQFLSDLTDAFKREKLSTENIDGTSTIDRIKQLIEVPSVSVPAKARTLLLEGRTLCRAKVISDVRAVFDASETPSKPEAAVVVHILRLSFHEGGSKNVREFSVALDSNDLDAMIDILNRAKTKERALETLLNRAETPFLKIE